MTVEEMLGQFPKMQAYSADVLRRVADTAVINENHWDDVMQKIKAMCTAPIKEGEEPSMRPMFAGVAIYMGDANVMGDIGVLMGLMRDIRPYIKWEGVQVED